MRVVALLLRHLALERGPLVLKLIQIFCIERIIRRYLRFLNWVLSLHWTPHIISGFVVGFVASLEPKSSRKLRNWRHVNIVKVVSEHRRCTRAACPVGCRRMGRTCLNCFRKYIWWAEREELLTVLRDSFLRPLDPVWSGGFGCMLLLLLKLCILRKIYGQI